MTTSATAQAPPRPGRRSMLPRRLLALVLCGLLVLVAAAVSIAVGTRGIPLPVVVDVLLGGGDLETRTIVLGQRMPRTVLAVAGGAALATAGVLVQGHTRNPLADPGLLGVTAGASLMVVVSIAFLGLVDPAQYVWFALAGAAAALVAVTALGLLGGGRRDSSPATLVLAGSAVSALLSALAGVVLLLSESTFDLFRYFTVGSLGGAHDLAGLLPAFACIGAGLLIAVAHASTLDALSLGDDTARALGRNLAASRLVGLLSATLLVGGAVMCVGSLGFVGLVVPHVVRLLAGPAHRWLIPFSVLGGAAVVLAADIVGRVVVRPAEVPVGVVVALAGAPLFVLLVRRTGRRRT